MSHVRLFYPSESWLHRIHPSAKLVVYIGLSVLLGILPWGPNALLFLLTLAILASTRAPFRHYWLIVLFSLPVMVISPLLNGLWPPDPLSDHVIATIGGWPVYFEGLRRGVNRDFLFGGTMALTIAVLATTELPDLADAPTYLGLPHVFGFTLATTLRYIPEVGNFLMTLYDVQESRGVDFYTRNPAVNFWRRTRIFIPLLVFQLSRASRMSNAMESRGFRIRQAPTLYALRPMLGAERVAMYAVGAASVLLLLLRIYAAFVPGDYPFEFGTF